MLAPGVRAAGVGLPKAGTCRPAARSPAPPGPARSPAGARPSAAAARCASPSKRLAGDAGPMCCPRDGATVVLGAGQVLSNEAIVQAGNAALALNTLGATDRLVWYRAGLQDMPVAGNTGQPDEPAAGMGAAGVAVADGRRRRGHVLARAPARPAGGRAAAGPGPLGRDDRGPRPADQEVPRQSVMQRTTCAPRP